MNRSIPKCGEVPKRSRNDVIKSVLAQDSMIFWNKNLYLLLSNDKRKHKKCFRKLHENSYNKYSSLE